MIVSREGVSASCRYRSAVVCCVFLVGFAVIVSRLFYLQIIRAPEGARQAQSQHFESVEVQGDRGVIVDRSGSTLALNVEVPSAWARLARITDPKLVAQKLAPVLEVSASGLEEKLAQKHRNVQLKPKLTPEAAASIRALRLPGISIAMESHRFYPKGSLLSHLLGFAGRDSRGLEGLEWRFDSYLRGQKRTVQFRKDALMGRISLIGDGGQQPQEGYRLTLTIDEVIQYIAERELDVAMAETKAQRGAILVMDPMTGAVLAWVLRPSFDPNHFQDWPAELRVNRAVTDPYEPGSTLKVVIAAAALEAGVKTPDELIFCGNGEMPIAGTLMHDPKKHGWMSFADVMAYSSNIGMSKVAESLGPEQVYRFLRDFGFGERTGIDLPGESAGMLPSVEDWDGRTLSSLAIGQTVSVTPIQLLTAISAVANGGSLHRPYVVSSVEDPQRGSIVTEASALRREPISYETSQTLTEILTTVVTKGSGKKAGLREYSVAGKTGTAQKVDKDTKAYSSTKVIGSFVGFVPSRDPRLAMLVIIDEPEGKGWGGEVAAPVFRRVAEQALRHLKVAPQELGMMKVASLE